MTPCPKCGDRLRRQVEILQEEDGTQFVTAFSRCHRCGVEALTSDDINHNNANKKKTAPVQR